MYACRVKHTRVRINDGTCNVRELLCSRVWFCTRVHNSRTTTCFNVRMRATLARAYACTSAFMKLLLNVAPVRVRLCVVACCVRHSSAFRRWHAESSAPCRVRRVPRLCYSASRRARARATVPRSGQTRAPLPCAVPRALSCCWVSHL